jgi:hypothetical protein
MLRPSLVALAAFAAISCGETEEEPRNTSQVPEEVALDVMVEDGRLEILAVYPLEEWRDAVARGDRTLRYELRGDDGAPIAAGSLPDPRIVDVERGGSLQVPFGTASLRLPAKPGLLVFLEEGAEIGKVEFDPADVRFHGDDGLDDVEARLIDTDETSAGESIGSNQQTVLSPGDIRTTPRRIFGKRSRAAAGDILIVPEGYRRNQLDTFNRDARAISREFLRIMSSQRPYRKYFNIWVQEVESRGVGIDDPDNRRRVDTAFDVTFGRGDDRRGTWFGTPAGEAAARRLGRAVRADIIVVLANTTEHGGAALNGAFVFTKGPDSAPTMAHELGHALLGLADEYDYGGPPCQPGAPNLATSSRRESIPWRTRITPGTALPTRGHNSSFRTIGAFEGAGTCTEDRFRPQLRCLMRTLDRGFCTICLGRLTNYVQTLERRQNEGGTPCSEAFDNDGICDNCIPNDPDCASNNCGNGTCEGDETDANCAADCGCEASNCQLAPFGCYCDPACVAQGDCCADAEQVCDGF